jgi:chaperonin cofactor prefoldin
MKKEINSAISILEQCFDYIENLESKIEHLEKANIRLNVQVANLEEDIYELNNK